MTIKGLTVSVEMDAQVVTGHAYNGVLVDGGFGLYVGLGTATFSSFIVETDDSYFDGSTVPVSSTSNEAPTDSTSATSTTDSTSSASTSSSTDPDTTTTSTGPSGGGKGNGKGGK